MNWYWLLFSKKGRLNRLPYFLTSLILEVPVLFAEFQVRYEKPETLEQFAAYTVLGVLGWLSFFMMVFVSIKRLHDRDKSGSWLWIYFGIPAFVSILLGFFPGLFEAYPLIFTLPVFGLVVWAFIELVLLRGTVGDNRYGPDPLALQKSAE